MRYLFLLVAGCFSSLAWSSYSAVTEDGRAAIATVQPSATQVALEIYARGGNAVDAAIAAAFALGVVDGHNSGIGGGCFVLIRWADGTVEAIDGREMAPAKAHRDMFVRAGKVVPELSKVGPLAVGIPGAVAAYEYLSKRGGKLTWARLLEPSVALAEQGFAIDPIYAKRIVRHKEALSRFPGSAKILLDQRGDPWPAGHRLLQTDLAKTYRGIAKRGSDYFYRGPFAKVVGEWMTAHGGMIDERDFARYRLKKRTPIESRYGDYRVLGFGPPSSGGVHVAQMLTMLDALDLRAHSASERYQLMAEVMRLAFADRARWMGDADFVAVPKGLLDKVYLRERAAAIRLGRILADVSAGEPPRADIDLFEKHTTHIAAADREGNWVAITTTVNTDFGSKVVVPGTGVFLNNQMDDFSIQPGVANVYGLVGSEANAIAPGKRPLSSMSPTLVLKGDKPVLTLGAAGGPTIISQVVQTLNNHLNLGMDLAEAVAAPRIHHQWRPDVLFVEKTVTAEDRAALEKLGYHTRTLGPYGSTQAIGLDSSGRFVAVSEPRLLERNRVVADAKAKPLAEGRYLEVKPQK